MNGLEKIVKQLISTDSWDQSLSTQVAHCVPKAGSKVILCLD